jgi:hypothetical protein
MQKIISVFQRNYDSDRLIRDEVVPGAEWVLAGEGIATRKFEGSCCMVQDRLLYKRYDAKHGKQPPAGFVPAQDPDPTTGHWPGWLRVGAGPEDQWFRHALTGYLDYYMIPWAPDGTYEAIGPHFQGNPEHLDSEHLVEHGRDVLDHCPRSFADLREYLASRDIEGVVFWHRDGRRAKVKKKDYGLPRRLRVTAPTALDVLPACPDQSGVPKRHGGSPELPFGLVQLAQIAAVNDVLAAVDLDEGLVRLRVRPNGATRAPGFQSHDVMLTVKGVARQLKHQHVALPDLPRNHRASLRSKRWTSSSRCWYGAAIRPRALQ